MSALVPDASIAIKCVIAEPGSITARQLMAAADPLIAPELLLAECANVVWKRVNRGMTPRAGVPQTLDALESIAANLLPLRDLTRAALSIALEFDHPVYDCYYLAAAIQNDATLATADERLYDLALRAGLGERAILVR